VLSYYYNIVYSPQVPEGAVKLSHWWVVFNEEERKGIKVAFTLKRDHLDPTLYQKMKVRLGMQVNEAAKEWKIIH